MNSKGIFLFLFGFLIISSINSFLFTDLISKTNVNINEENEFSQNPFVSRLEIHSSDFLYGVDYLIIVPDENVDAVQALANWKSQKGVSAVIIPIGFINSNYDGIDLAAKIKACITDYHENYQTKWVLLAGDEDDVPTREAYAPEDYYNDGDYVSCDSYYTDLDNDWDSNNNQIWGELDDNLDYHPEVYVGRLSANSYSELKFLADRIVQYESAPPDGDWFGTALMAGAQLFFDEDWDNDSQPDYLGGDYNRFTHFIDKTVLNNSNTNWSTYYMGETQGLVPTKYSVNESISEEGLVAQLNHGYSIGAIAGHGNPYSMYRTLFSKDYDGDGLFDRNGTGYYASPIDETLSLPLITTYDDLAPNANVLGFYYLGGCSVGTFNSPTDCLTETFLKTIAIGAIGGSQVVWGEDEWYEREFGGWYSDGLTYRFFEQLMANPQPGAALALAKEDYVLDRANPLYYNSDRPYYPDWENKTLKQMNLMGDPEVRLWFDRPQIMNVTKDYYQNSTNIMISDNNNLPIVNATITITRNESVIFKGFSSLDGIIQIPYNSSELNTFNLTVYHPGYLPYQNLNEIQPDEPQTDDTSSDDTSSDFTSDDDNNSGLKISGFYTPIIMGVLVVSLTGLYNRRKS